jgi:membrane-associated protein
LLSIINDLINNLVLYGNWAYLILFLGSYLETVMFLSFIVHGEVFFIIGALLAGANVLNFWLVSLVIILGGIFGDSTSYFLGKYFNKKFYSKPPGKLREKANKFMEKYGAKAVFFARFLGPLSWVMPFVAGLHKLKYTDFLKYNIPGVILGIGQFLVLGYFLGYSYNVFFKKYWYLGVISLIILVLVFLYHKQIFLYFKVKLFKKKVKGKPNSL